MQNRIDQFRSRRPLLVSRWHLQNRKLSTRALVACAAVLMLPMQLLSQPQSSKKSDSPKWEYKAVFFSKDEKNGTKRLNDLADEGWQHVGLLGNGLVAFRRPSLLLNQIMLEVVNTPGTIAAGEKTTITVTVRDGDHNLLSGANVAISAGGGRFLPTADAPFDPKDRLHGPYSAAGTTDQKGQLTTWWVVNPAASGYGLSITASKEGYTDGTTELAIKLK